MSQYPSKSKTVLWVLLTGVALPALVYAGELFASGDVFTAGVAAAVGAVAFVAFMVSYLAEFPGEEVVKEELEDLSLSEEDVQHLVAELGEGVRDEMGGGDGSGSRDENS